MKIKVEPFLMKKGNRVAKAAIEFEQDDGILAGFHLLGFTICDDKDKGLFVLFPSTRIDNPRSTQNNNIFFFLKPLNDEMLGKLENKIIDVYEDMINFNHPRTK